MGGECSIISQHLLLEILSADIVEKRQYDFLVLMYSGWNVGSGYHSSNYLLVCKNIMLMLHSRYQLLSKRQTLGCQCTNINNSGCLPKLLITLYIDNLSEPYLNITKAILILLNLIPHITAVASPRHSRSDWCIPCQIMWTAINNS